MSFNLQYIV